MANILIVDDEIDICELFEFEFQSLGHNTRSALTVDDAKQLIDIEVPDLILSDVRMPGGNGLVLLDWVRKKCDPSLIFLLMTGYSDISLEKAFAQGAHGLFYKPLDLAEVTNFAQRSLEIRKDAGPAQRKSVRKEVDCDCLLTNHSTGQNAKGRLKDISRGGLFVCFTELLDFSSVEIGTPLHFRFLTGSGNNSEVAGDGIVRWMLANDRDRKSPKGLGLEFTQLSLPSIENLFLFLTKLEAVPLS